MSVEEQKIEATQADAGGGQEAVDTTVQEQETDATIDSESEDSGDDISWAMDDDGSQQETVDDAKDKPGTQEEAEPSPPEGEAGQDLKKKDGEEKAEKKPGEKAPDGTKPPEGYVPQAALHEERNKRKELAARVEQLEASLAEREVAPSVQPRQEPTQTPRKVSIPEDIREDVDVFVHDFPELAGVVQMDIREGADLREAISELGPKDPSVRAMAYNISSKIEMHKVRAAQQQRESEARQAKTNAFIDTCLDEMEAVAPGLFDENSPVGPDLLETAKTAGIDPTEVAVLTDPRAIITILDGNGKESRKYLGAGAVSVVKMLSTLKNLKAEGEGKFTQTDMDKAVADAVAEALKKTNDRPDEDRFRGLGSAPGASDVPEDLKNVEDMTDEQWDRLTRAQKDKYLGIA
ncbi:MAG: hypothetical protein KKE73_10905 [Proteobacteria bacterium]|nr:hypothetical protein [Pseudomonadota bacterium]